MNIKLTHNHCMLAKQSLEAAVFALWNFLYWRLKKVV